MSKKKQNQILLVGNLREGMVVKNYLDMCNKLGIKPSTGVGRISDHYWFEEHFSYVKDGHEYIIMTIYWDREPTPKRGRGRPVYYNEQVRLIASIIVSSLIHRDEDDYFLLSRTKMLEYLNMSNINYGYCKSEVLKLIEYLGVDIGTVNEWFQSTTNLMVRNLDKALSGLVESSYISWDMIKTISIHTPSRGMFSEVGKSNEKVFFGKEVSYKARTSSKVRVATPRETQLILDTEQRVLESMGLDNKGVAVASGRWEEFRHRVFALLLEDFGISMYWDSYDIRVRPKEDWIMSDDMEIQLFDTEELQAAKKQLNEMVIENVNSLAKDRSLKAIEDNEVGGDVDSTTLRRKEHKYIEECLSLSENLMSREAEDIRELVEKCKITYRY